MSGDALVIGEALIDEVIDSGRSHRHPGGSPANVAIGLSRLGAPTRLHTAIGDDDDGDLIRTHLRDSGVVLTGESAIVGSTSRAIATLAAGGSASYEFALEWAPRPLAEVGAPAVIHTGSLGIALDPGANLVADLVERGRAGGALVTVDPNVRSSLIGEPRRALERFLRIAQSSQIIKLSNEDAAFLFPGNSIDEVLDRLIDLGVAVVAITEGSRGAVLASGANRTRVAAVPTVVTDTVGAGDAFMAALIWTTVFDEPGWDGEPISLSRLAQIGATAAQAAAITVSRSGANLPTVGELRGESTDVHR